jgi:hypothetical protein
MIAARAALTRAAGVSPRRVARNTAMLRLAIISSADSGPTSTTLPLSAAIASGAALSSADQRG